MEALRRHERDAHGPRMRCSQCDFTCPERRHFEMKRHKEMKQPEKGKPHVYKNWLKKK